jgi:hypothetical protein
MNSAARTTDVMYVSCELVMGHRRFASHSTTAVITATPTMADVRQTRLSGMSSDSFTYVGGDHGDPLVGLGLVAPGSDKWAS